MKQSINLIILKIGAHALKLFLFGLLVKWGRSKKCVQFFFLWHGRSRSKARSLHEKKLLLRKLLHGHRWSHAAWQIIKTKTQTTKNTRQDADPPARFASHHQKDSKANSERGKSPTETTTKDLPRHSGKNPLCRNRLKNLQQTN